MLQLSHLQRALSSSDTSWSLYLEHKSEVFPGLSQYSKWAWDACENSSEHLEKSSLHIHLHMQRPCGPRGKHIVSLIFVACNHIHTEINDIPIHIRNFRYYQRGSSRGWYQMSVPKYLIRLRNGLFLVPDFYAEVPYKVPEWPFFGTRFLCRSTL